ncbi:hypothetical protein I5W14_21775 [Stenotrophomonas maltophilia]|nr:hypothetical protein [Stenotrophomonas maltophilia]MBN5048232.1 hypothetical protein [Stenotrophomonas maltophilia]MBN5155421.1 hypothetical protein [Stenotrophomonas maltophilia]
MGYGHFRLASGDLAVVVDIKLGAQLQSDGYPANWDRYDRNVFYVGAGQFGFVTENGDVNRFAARFRAAACYRGVNLEGYSATTAAGYSALCRVIFIWSAFEGFLHICGLDQRTVGPILNARGALGVIEDIRRADIGGVFYGFIRDRVNATHRRELDNFFNDDPCNVGYLASAIRHIFAHGWLTPNANQVNSDTVLTVCNRLCDFLLEVMDREFECRVADGLDDLMRR